eukprot:g10231.t1
MTTRDAVPSTAAFLSTAPTPTLPPSARFSVEVESVDFKFSSAHFVASRGFRERLHGHNYTVKVALEGKRVNLDGYVIDFGDVKDVTKRVCKGLNEKVLVPVNSDVLRIYYRDLSGPDNFGALLAMGQEGVGRGEAAGGSSERSRTRSEEESSSREGGPTTLRPGDSTSCAAVGNISQGLDGLGLVCGEAVVSAADEPELLITPRDDVFRRKKFWPTPCGRQVEIVTETGGFFSLPERDCCLLPIDHTTAEELAVFLWRKIHDELLQVLKCDSLKESRGIEVMEIAVAERPIQKAYYKREVR